MQFFTHTSDLISLVSIMSFGLLLTLALARAFELPKGRALALFVWHSLFSAIYTIYVSKFGGDMLGYYIMAQKGVFEFDIGTHGIYFLSTMMYQAFSLSFLNMAMLYGLFGLVGLLAFDASLRHVTEDKSPTVKLLATIIVFLPSVSFWSAGMGKDAIAFMAVGLALWASLNFSQRKTILIIAILSMLFVRPHMAGLMVLAVAMASLVSAQVSLVQRVVIGGLALVAAAVMVPFALDYAGLGQGTSASADDVMAFIEKRQGYNLDGAGGIDIAGMSLPMQMFTYLFRPLPFEARSIAAVAASLDNMLLLYLFFVGIVAMSRKILPHPDVNSVFIWSYSMSSLMVLAMTTANMGIALRQKWMFVPFLIVLLISFVGSTQQDDEDEASEEASVFPDLELLEKQRPQ